MITADLTGKVAIVTGASSGLGARFATVLADAGADVVAAARRLDRLEQLGEGRRIAPVRCDVTDAADVERLVETALKRFGRIDICVNNAGGSSGGPDRQATLEAFRGVIRLNLDSVFALSQAVARPMREQGSGSVINISSMFSLVASAPVPDAGYVASKSAVNGLTRELAAQWAGDGVRVNAIAPGAVLTPRVAALLDEARRAESAASIPLGRLAAPDDIAHAVTFLASDLASYITGQTLVIDGGATVQFPLSMRA